MADITVIRAYREAGKICIIGSNFTATTTTVFVDDDECPFELVSSAAIEVEDVPGATEVSVSKGEVELTVTIEETPMSQTADYTESPANPATATYTPVFPTPISAEDVKTEQEKQTTPDPVTPAQDSPGPAEPMNLMPKEPYPTGSPPDASLAFGRIHGSGNPGAKPEDPAPEAA